MIPPHSSTSSYSILSPLNPCLNPNTSFTTLVHNITTNNNVVREEVVNSDIASTSYDLKNNNMNLQWRSEFPPGYRFCPKDDELINYYLKRRILNLQLAHDKIKDVNIYATTPQKLSEEYEPVGENEWYFFTPRERKYKNGGRPNRATNRVEGKSDGYWKATGADKEIFNPLNKEEIIGHKKALVFYKGQSPNGEKTNWIMHEFRAANATTRKRLHDNDMRLDDCVLCRIYNKIEKSPKGGSIKAETSNEPNPNPNPNYQEEEVGAVEVEANVAQAKVVVAKDEKLLPEEEVDQFLYDQRYYDEETMNLFEENNPDFMYNYSSDRIGKKDEYPPPQLQLPDLAYTFPDPSQNWMKFDGLYSNNYHFNYPEKKSFLSTMMPLSNILQTESPGVYNPTFFDGQELNNNFIASSKNPSTNVPSPKMDVDEDVVID